MTTMARIDQQAISGVVPPQQGEALIREVWATVTSNSAASRMARKAMNTIILAPLGWLMLAPLFAMRLLGFLPGLSGLTVKYTLTNRRLMIRRGMKARMTHEIPLNQIRDVHITVDENSEFYGTGTLDVQNLTGEVAFKMPGIGDPESFRQAILQARDAWGPLL